MKHSLIDQKCTEFANDIANTVRNLVFEAFKERTSPAPKKSHLPMDLAPGQKRGAADIDRLVRHLSEFIAENPGLCIEDIAVKMGVSTRELRLPVKKLMELKYLTTTGQKRATRYYSNEHKDLK